MMRVVQQMINRFMAWVLIARSAELLAYQIIDCSLTADQALSFYDQFDSGNSEKLIT